MKKSGILLLVFLYLFSVTDLKELFRVRFLAQHYLETKALDNSVSLLDFIEMHYLTDDGNQTDNEQDAQLPFKSSSPCNGATYISIFHPVKISFTSSSLVSENEFKAFKETSPTSTYFASVWRPPQIV